LSKHTIPVAMETNYIGRNRRYFDMVDSTNNYASLIAGKSGIPEGTLVWAGFQSAGRGQAGNRWESEAGKNLTFSLILYPHFLPPEMQFLLSEAVSLGITDFLTLYIPNPLIKWPNDIYAENRKIGGILIEHSRRLPSPPYRHRIRNRNLPESALHFSGKALREPPPRDDGPAGIGLFFQAVRQPPVEQVPGCIRNF